MSWFSKALSRAFTMPKTGAQKAQMAAAEAAANEAAQSRAEQEATSARLRARAARGGRRGLLAYFDEQMAGLGTGTTFGG